MKPRLHSFRLFSAGALLLSLPLTVPAASDLLPPQRRQAAVEIAEKLKNREAPPALSEETPNPFNPVGFDAPDPAVLAAQAARDAAAAAAGQSLASDRAVLEILADRLTPSGTFIVDGRSLLIIDRNRFEVGTKFIVTYEGRDHELQLISIDRTTFTLRYRNEEITRPIKPSR